MLRISEKLGNWAKDTANSSQLIPEITVKGIFGLLLEIYLLLEKKDPAKSKSDKKIIVH